MSNKIIRDSLHGYISLPEIVLDKIVDTPIFQRLKRIEQTSMRPLYPSAHHDRFIHSLGVYYLGEKALDSLIKNIKSNDSYYNNDNKITVWEHYGLLFRIACLLHDCAHAPFSHSFEFAYLGSRGSEKWENIKKELKNSLPGNSDTAETEYNKDIDILFNDKPAPHEVFSAIIVAHRYSKAIECIYAELLKEFYPQLTHEELKNSCPFLPKHIEFIQRAILGMKYNIKTKNVIPPDVEVVEDYGETSIDNEESENEKNNILNCLIRLLNSKSFDVDKLDYIMRDSVAAGINNLSVDVERILGALTIIEIHNFNEETDVDYDINNSITFKSLDQTNGSSNIQKLKNNICALNLSLKDVLIQGNLIGSIETTTDEHKIYSYDDKIKVGSPSEDKVIIKGEGGEIKARLDNAKMIGSFTGIIKSLNSTDKGVDGFIKCHIKGSVHGSVIGTIEEKWAEKGLTLYEIGYKQSALSIIDDTIYARNRLYLWIYAHHKVAYIDYLLRYAVLKALSGERQKNKFDYKDYREANEKLENMLSLNVFDEDQSPNYLLDDSKFITLITENRSINDFAEKYLSRIKEYSIWKNFAEYNRFFYDLTAEEKEKVWKSLFINTDYESYKSYNDIKEGTVQMCPNSILNEYPGDYNFVWIKPSGYKLSKIDSSETYLVSNDLSVRRFKDVIEKEKTAEEYVDENYFYLYTSKPMTNGEKFELISFIKSKIRGSSNL
ncbi:hypothetical protein FACS189476_10250 [Spirochaetia bacterium]|nr:hypothetical protein FACS189476_10250 [Spirochaetia bacterium]